MASRKTGDQNASAVTTSERHFFGRRKGRKLSERRLSALQADLALAKIDLARPARDEAALKGLFAEGVAEVWLEVGFGAGEHLIFQLLHHPTVGIIGAEPFLNGVASALRAAREQAVAGRMRCHNDDVVDLLSWLPRESLGRAFMLFPDPWPKKRHRDRRLFSPAFLAKLLPALKRGAEFRFASDIADYAAQAIDIAEGCPQLEIARIFTSAERQTVPDWPQTRYELKAVREGRASTFIILRKT